MARRARLDAELVRRGLARSREQANALIGEGRVMVAGAVATKPATAVSADTPVFVRPGRGNDIDYVSRGAHKLLGALQEFSVAEPGLSVAGKHCLDAGASTGGFTDVLLRAGARRVVAVDVGYGQLAWSLRTDPRVRILERTNVRHLEPDRIDGPAELTVADLSFIGLRTVLPNLIRCTRPDGDLVVLVKPQFEVGRERLGAGGVVRDPALRAEAIGDVAVAAQELGARVRGVVASRLPGPRGNVEFLLWLTGADGACPEPQDATALEATIARAMAEGPA